jgi:DNA-binding response OmpR family regulator
MPGSNLRTVCTHDHECNLLAVDDDDLILEILGEFFTPQTGIRLITATTLSRAIYLIQTVPNIEAVLLDLRLHDSDGIETLQRVVEASGGRVAIIGISGSHELEDAVMENGAVDFWGKPLDQIDMVARTKYAILNQRRMNYLRDICDALESKIAAIEGRAGIETDTIEQLASVRREIAQYASALGGTH